jgi:hypothetical protein
LEGMGGASSFAGVVLEGEASMGISSISSSALDGRVGVAEWAYSSSPTLRGRAPAWGVLTSEMFDDEPEAFGEGEVVPDGIVNEMIGFRIESEGINVEYERKVLLL